MADGRSSGYVDPELLSKLLELGINEEAARKACILTNNESLELATSLALDLAEDEVEDQLVMFFVVNSSLNMGMGETAIMVSEATMKLYHEILALGGIPNLNIWRNLGEKKMVLKTTDESQLTHIKDEAISLNIPYVSVIRSQESSDSGPISVMGVFGGQVQTYSFLGELNIL